MLRKLFVIALLLSCASALVYAQTPGAKKDYEKGIQVFGWSLESNGGYLGVQSIEVTKENFSQYGLPDVRGVAVEKVIEGSPAQTAGLQEGDVIVEFNGEAVTSTRKLSRLINEIAPDHKAKLRILRRGDDREITVTLAKRLSPKFTEGGFSAVAPGPSGRLSTPPLAELPLFRRYPGDDRDVLIFRGESGRRIGVSVTALTKQLSDHFGVSGGVLITNVRENSPAAKAGLKAGDVIVDVEGKEVKSDLDLVRAIAEKKDGSIQMTIVRDKNRQTFDLTPEETKGDWNSFFETPEGSLVPPAKIRTPRPAAPATPVPMLSL